MHLLLFSESLLYFVCLSIIFNRIFNQRMNKIKYSISFLLYLLVLLTSFFISKKEVVVILYLAYNTLAIIFLRLAFSYIKLLKIAFAYFTIYSVDIIIVSLVNIFTNTPQIESIYIEVIVNITVMTLYIIICYTRLSTKIVMLIDLMPRLAKVFSSTVLFLGMFLITLVMDENFFQPTEAWFSYVQRGVVIGVILLILITAFTVSISLSKIQLEQRNKRINHQLKIQREFYDDKVNRTFELRRFKHDHKNALYSIEVLMRQNKTEQALKSIREHREQFDKISQIKFETGNDYADALFSDKLKLARKHNTEIVFNGVIPANAIEIDDVLVLFGNMLDNAIEACEKIDNDIHKIITVNSNCCNGILFINVSNPVSAKVKINDNHIVTTKSDKTQHGIGLYSINEIARKYSGELKLTSTDNLFTVDMTLYLSSI